MSTPTPKQKLEIFEHSYQEVLAALKHQDDKLNRTLTALAFLTVAGVSLFPRLTESGESGLGDSGPAAPDVLFMVFLVAVALGVIVALTAIGPGSPLRRPPSRERRGERDPSLIFYARIAYDEHWKERRGKSPEELTEMLTENFHLEAQDIAGRVDYKVSRSREATAWVELAIVSLALMGVSGATGLSSSARWWIAMGLITIVLVIPLWDLFLMLDTKYISKGFSTAAYVMLATIVVFAVTFLVLGQLLDAPWEALGYASLAFLVPRYAIVRSKLALPLLICGLVAAVPVLLAILL